MHARPLPAKQSSSASNFCLPPSTISRNLKSSLLWQSPTTSSFNVESLLRRHTALAAAGASRQRQTTQSALASLGKRNDGLPMSPPSTWFLSSQASAPTTKAQQVIREARLPPIRSPPKAESSEGGDRSKALTPRTTLPLRDGMSFQRPESVSLLRRRQLGSSRPCYTEASSDADNSPTYGSTKMTGPAVDHRPRTMALSLDELAMVASLIAEARTLQCASAIRSKFAVSCSRAEVSV